MRFCEIFKKYYVENSQRNLVIFLRDVLEILCPQGAYKINTKSMLCKYYYILKYII
jgi:hypothetical protein